MREKHPETRHPIMLRPERYAEYERALDRYNERYGPHARMSMRLLVEHLLFAWLTAGTPDPWDMARAADAK